MRYLILSIFLLLSFTIYSQSSYETQILPFDGLEYDYFGATVALNDSLIIIGSPLSTSSSAGAGKVYVYKIINQDLELVQILVPPELDPEANFGVDIVLSDNELFIGARKEIHNGIKSGAIYFYTNYEDEWILKQKILPPDPIELLYFGEELYLNQNFLAVGVPYDRSNGQYSGSVYIYRFDDSTWRFSQKIIPADFKSYQFFGNSIALNNNKLIVGAYADSNKYGTNAGAVYFFELSDTSYTQKRKILSQSGGPHNAFGGSVDFNGNYLIIGEPGDIYANIYGSVHLFNEHNNDFIFCDQIFPSDGVLNNTFGGGIVISDSSVIIGAGGDSGNNLIANGAVYRYDIRNCSFINEIKFFTTNPNAGGYPAGINIFEANTLIGATSSLQNGIRTGAAYLYSDLILNTETKRIQKTPANKKMISNYPNPFNSTTKIVFDLEEDSGVELSVYSILGDKISTTNQGKINKGQNEIHWDASMLVSGIYIVVLRATNDRNVTKILTNKICLIR